MVDIFPEQIVLGSIRWDFFPDGFPDFHVQVRMECNIALAKYTARG